MFSRVDVTVRQRSDRPTPAPPAGLVAPRDSKDYIAWRKPGMTLCGNRYEPQGTEYPRKSRMELPH
jgi:hypothetical protein